MRSTENTERSGGQKAEAKVEKRRQKAEGKKTRRDFIAKKTVPWRRDVASLEATDLARGGQKRRQAAQPQKDLTQRAAETQGREQADATAKDQESKRDFSPPLVYDSDMTEAVGVRPAKWCRELKS